MKKIIAFLLVAVMAMSLVACGGAETDDAVNKDNNKNETPVASVPDNAPATLATIDPSLPACNDATTVLRFTWAQYTEEQRFFAMGGEYDNLIDGNAGDVAADSEFLTGNLLVPADQVTNIAEAGSLLHSMNANTFTAGAYKLVDGADVAAFATAMQDSIQNNQWVCGFPETLLVVEADGIVVVVFGNGEIVENFKNNMILAYTDIEVVIEEAIG